MRRLALWLAAAFLAVVLGCGGGVGGGGGGPQVLGRVLNVETGGPTNPRSSVQIGSESTLTSASDGSFTLAAALGTSSLSVDTLSAFGVWIFSFPPISGTTDIGDLWVGPEKVAVTGFVRNAATNDGIAGATVVFTARMARMALTKSASPAAIPVIVEKHRFEKLSGGRKPGQMDGTHHYRRGAPGEWQSVFKPEDIPVLQKLYGEHFARQGYPI